MRMGFNYTEARLGFFLLLPTFLTHPDRPNPTNTDANVNRNTDANTNTNTKYKKEHACSQLLPKNCKK